MIEALRKQPEVYNVHFLVEHSDREHGDTFREALLREVERLGVTHVNLITEWEHDSRYELDSGFAKHSVDGVIWALQDRGITVTVHPSIDLPDRDKVDDSPESWNEVLNAQGWLSHLLDGAFSSKQRERLLEAAKQYVEASARYNRRREVHMTTQLDGMLPSMPSGPEVALAEDEVEIPPLPTNNAQNTVVLNAIITGAAHSPVTHGRKDVKRVAASIPKLVARDFDAAPGRFISALLDQKRRKVRSGMELSEADVEQSLLAIIIQEELFALQRNVQNSLDSTYQGTNPVLLLVDALVRSLNDEERRRLLDRLFSSPESKASHSNVLYQTKRHLGAGIRAWLEELIGVSFDDAPELFKRLHERLRPFMSAWQTGDSESATK